MKELKNIDVHLISLVDKGANKRTVICKAAGIKDDDKYTLQKNDVRIAKIDDEKHLVYGVVYAPNDEDAHGDFATAEEIEKACHNFLAKSNTSKAVDTQHNLEPVEGITIVECAIIKGEHSILKGEPDGTWFIVTKIENEEIWKSVKDGTYTGYSLYGFAERAEESKGIMKEKFFDRLYKMFQGEEDSAERNEVIKGFDEVYRKMQLRTMADALCSAVWEVLWNDMLSVEEKIDEVGKVMDDCWSKMSTIDLAKAEISKAGKVISDSNKKKLEAAQTAIQELLDLAGTAENKKSIQKTKIKNTDMEKITKEDLDKAVADAVKKSEDEKAELQKKLDAANAELEKSKGSAQVEDPKPVEKADGKKIFKWV